MVVALRPHHLLCMLTYVGKGYSEAFCANYDGVVERLGAGEAILLVDGPDAICGPVLDAADSHCRNESVGERDAAALAAVAALIGRPLAAGASFAMDAGLLGAMRDAFRQGTTRQGCGGCQWTAICDAVSAAGYPDVRLRIEAPRKALPETG